MGYDSLTAISNRHDFDTTFTNAYSGNQTATTVITPTTGKSLKITGVYISTAGATTSNNSIRLFFQTSANTVVIFYPSAVSGDASAVFTPILVSGAVNEPLKITSNLGLDENYFISVNYKEE
jgi:hypothetical protein